MGPCAMLRPASIIGYRSVGERRRRKHHDDDSFTVTIGKAASTARSMIAMLFFSAIPCVTLAQEDVEAPDCSPENLDDCSPEVKRSWLRRFSLGATDQVERRLTIDALPGDPLFRWPTAQRWNDWKQRMQADNGIAWSIDYINARLRADSSPGEDTGFGGALRLSGLWELTGDDAGDSGALVWKVEHRHAYGSHVSPQSLAGEVGYAGLLHLTLSDQRGRLSNLYWRQRFNDGDLVLFGGWVDTSDYMDVYMLGSPWTSFFNYAFSTGSASIPVPDEGLGIAVGGYLNKHVYMVGGIADANSDPHRPQDAFDTFFGDAEYFRHLDIGWNQSRGTAFLNNLHFTFWQVDERTDADVSDGWGINFSWSHLFSNFWTTFLRAGHAEDGGAVLEKTVSTGFSWSRVPGGNLLGVGLNWGRPMQSTYGEDLPDQTTLEVFYRIQLFEDLAITPDIQYIRNPAQNPDDDSLLVLGVRMRIAI